MAGILEVSVDIDGVIRLTASIPPTAAAQWLGDLAMMLLADYPDDRWPDEPEPEPEPE